MQYAEALDYLYSRLPVFHRIGPKALKPGLGNTLRLCAALDNPQQRFRSIHVAGTNGKGSTAHMLAAVYQAAGYRVGLYTSPHLKSFTERIRLNGEPIAEAAVAGFVTEHQALIEAIEPSFFELTVAMAFDFFARSAPNVTIVEVGLGGRLDSTNVITPLASVITNIGFDHTDILGDTLPQIAGQKAGIIKDGVPVIIGETQAETEPVFRAEAERHRAPIYFSDQLYRAVDQGWEESYRRVAVTGPAGEKLDLRLDLPGSYQLQNLLPVLAAVQTLQAQLPVPTPAIRDGLSHVRIRTGLKGRFQILGEQPLVVADTAHNPPGLAALFAMINTIPRAALRVVLGLVADKDRSAVLAALPADAHYYFCQAHTPRSLPADLLQEEARSLGRSGDSFTDVNAALQTARQQAAPDDLILITGSNFIVAELIDL